MKEGTNGNSVSAPKELKFEGKELGCGTPGIRVTPSFYGKGNAGSEAGGAAVRCLWQTLEVRGWRNHPGRVRSGTQHKAALLSLCRCPPCPSSLEKNCLFMWLGVDGAIFLRGLIVLLTAQIIRNENPGVRATAPSAVNMFQPHLAGGLEGSGSHPPHPQQKPVCSGGLLQELSP